MSASLVDSGRQLELQHLLSALCDNEITDDQYNRLEELLGTDQQCKRTYIQYMELHSALLLAGKDNVLLPYSSKDDFVCDIGNHTTVAPEGTTPSEMAGPQARSTQNISTIAYRYFLVAVATLLATVLVQVFWWRPADNKHGKNAVDKTNGQAVQSATPFVATLRDAVDCVWEKPASAPQVGARLAAGEMNLPKGIVYVQFDSGPEIVVEGPAELRLDSSTAATLLSGKVVLRADESAAPFDLHTPMSTLAEVGTEFAISVTRDTEEIHVFEGEVRRTPKSASHGNMAENLKAGEARHYVAKSANSSKSTLCDPKKFVRHVGNSGPRPEAPAELWVYEGFDYRSQNMMAMGKANGGIGWFGPWKSGFIRPAGDNDPPRFALNLRDGLSRPDAAIPAVGGTFDYAGFATASRRLARPLRLDVDGTFYLSYLVRRYGPPSDPFNAAALMFWTHEDFMQQKFENARQRLYIGMKKSNQLTARLQRMDSQKTITFNNDETYLIVAKIVASRSSSDQIFLRIYGAEESIESAETPNWTLTSTPFQSDLLFDWMQLHINSKTRQSIDEVRLGTTWSSVTSAYRRRLGI